MIKQILYTVRYTSYQISFLYHQLTMAETKYPQLSPALSIHIFSVKFSICLSLIPLFHFFIPNFLKKCFFLKFSFEGKHGVIKAVKHIIPPIIQICKSR